RRAALRRRPDCESDRAADRQEHARGGGRARPHARPAAPGARRAGRFGKRHAAGASACEVFGSAPVLQLDTTLDGGAAMKKFWIRDEVSRELRAARPKPPAGLETALEQRIEVERGRSRGRMPSYRLGLAATATALLVASFAAAGGMAAASSSVRHALSSVAQAVHITSPSTHTGPGRQATPASDQYGRQKSCVK